MLTVASRTAIEIFWTNYRRLHAFKDDTFDQSHGAFSKQKSYLTCFTVSLPFKLFCLYDKKL